MAIVLQDVVCSYQQNSSLFSAFCKELFWLGQRTDEKLSKYFSAPLKILNPKLPSRKCSNIIEGKKSFFHPRRESPTTSLIRPTVVLIPNLAPHEPQGVLPTFHNRHRVSHYQ
jgi:hypothetical protein